MPIAWWILDYRSYDPIGSKNNPAFRNNIYTVNNNQIQLFLDSICNDKITLDDLKNIIFEYKNNEYDNYDELLFFIDFDKYVYITSFSEIEVEKYLPEKWIGISDNPLRYLPNDLNCLWKKKN